MSQPEIVINVRDGVIQEVYCSEELADLVIVDWDEPGTSGANDAVAVSFHERNLHAAVSHPIIYPTWQLAGTEVEAAIEASEQLQGAAP